MIKLGVTDKNGNDIYENDVIYDGVHYWNIGYSPNDGTIEAMACTYGYWHNITQDKLANVVRIGPVAENLKLLQCD